MKKQEAGEFYVGYLPRAPRSLARRVRQVCAVLFLVTAAVAVLLVSGQHPFALSRFEYQQYREYTGWLRAQPYPTLLVERAGSNTPVPYLLVAPGKHGAAADVAGFDGQRVRLRGALITRDGVAMLELEPQSLARLGNANNFGAAVTENLGVFTLAGEIVDSKCYLGVMNPGHTKPHRECAARCISGGIPPLFIARDGQGNTNALLLVSAAGAPVNQVVLDFVAEPVEIRGEVVRVGEQLYLRADPASYRRLP